MNENFDRVLNDIGAAYESEILPDSRYYIEVDIGIRGEQLDAPEVGHRYRGVQAIVPTKKPAGAMRVRVDGRTFVNYVQFDSGVVVPGYAAKNSSHRHLPYTAQDSMILGFG